MKRLYKLYDTEYPFKGIKKKRIVVRALIYNDNGEVLMHKIYGKRSFGLCNYYETPGGGKERFETKISALKREIKEETGYLIDSIVPIGKVIDFYNMFRRKNINYYYFAKAIGKGNSDKLDYEKQVIESTKFYKVDEIVKLINELNSTTKVGRLIKNRELEVIKMSYDFYLKYKEER